MSDINATGSLREEVVTATLTLGGASLTLTYLRDNEQAAEDMAELVERSEESFVRVLEALVSAAEEAEANA